MKFLKIYSLFLFVALMGLVSCDETEEAGEYDNWAARNVAFIDSIANVARANESGDWKVFLVDGINDTLQWDNQYYVYCNVVRNSDSVATPGYSDTVLVNYRGRLIPSKTYPDGNVFDESYLGKLDPEVNVPQKMNVSGLSILRGWTTAVSHMSKGTTRATGDVWRVYIPSTLGYEGSTSVSRVPAYSTLIFDLNLVDFYPVGTPVPGDY
jgi:FKBP-type peptidyl-prolyl cis-trans isomerase FklB